MMSGMGAMSKNRGLLAGGGRVSKSMVGERWRRVEGLMKGRAMMKRCVSTRELDASKGGSYYFSSSVSLNFLLLRIPRHKCTTI